MGLYLGKHQILSKTTRTAVIEEYEPERLVIFRSRQMLLLRPLAQLNARRKHLPQRRQLGRLDLVQLPKKLGSTGWPHRVHLSGEVHDADRSIGGGADASARGADDGQVAMVAVRLEVDPARIAHRPALLAVSPLGRVCCETVVALLWLGRDRHIGGLVLEWQLLVLWRCWGLDGSRRGGWRMRSKKAGQRRLWSDRCKPYAVISSMTGCRLNGSVLPMTSLQSWQRKLPRNPAVHARRSRRRREGDAAARLLGQLVQQSDVTGGVGNAV